MQPIHQSLSREYQLLFAMHVCFLVSQGRFSLLDQHASGAEREKEINKHLNTPQIILLLISPNFMASDYCYSTQMQRALERHERGQAHVIPIILRPVYWQGSAFGKLQALPTDAMPTTSRHWNNLDEAFFNVAEGIRKVVDEVSKQSVIQTAVRVKETQSDHTHQREINDQDGSSDLQVLKEQFHEAMLNIYKEAAKIGYHANQFVHMVNQYRGVETAHMLLAKEPTEGFTKLWEKKRLDLSVEALVLKPNFSSLFDESEREKARKRLADYGYKAP